jgi:hypothetical protein
MRMSRTRGRSVAAEKAITRNRWLAVAATASALATMPRAGQAQSESDLAKASQNPIAHLTSFPLQYNFN